MEDQWDPVRQGGLHGPHFSTAGWDQEFRVGKAPGLHPVEMLARIAKFEGKSEPRYEPYTKNFRGRGSLGKICKCVYDGGYEAFGNGKMDKQAKLVAAWNMIERLKKDNIGIVNETLATGIVVDKSVLKKPVAGQFTSFKKAGTLSSSFVSASSSSSSGPTPAKVEMPVVIESVAERLAREAKKEVEEYQRSLLEGEKQEDGLNEETMGVSSPPKITFKRSHDDLGDSEEYNNVKVAKTNTEAGQPLFGAVNSPQNSIGPQALPKPPISDPAPTPEPENSSVPKFGYDWGRGAHRGGQQGRGRGSSGAGTRPGDWPCSACGNYNFAWRSTCNQCAQPKQANTMPVAYPGWGYNPGYGANYGNGYG